MRNRINLLALVVIAAGGALFARPAPANATYLDPWRGTGESTSCCTKHVGGWWGRDEIACCSSSGCFIASDGKCLPLA